MSYGFTEDLTPPEENKFFKVYSYVDTKFKLIHKLVFFPNLLKTYLEGLSSETIEDIIDSQTRTYELTALYLAVHGSYVESIKLLLHYGADINIINEKGYSPLSRALSTGNYTISKLLILHSKHEVDDYYFDREVSLMLSSVWEELYKESQEKIKEMSKLRELDIGNLLYDASKKYI